LLLQRENRIFLSSQVIFSSNHYWKWRMDPLRTSKATKNMKQISPAIIINAKTKYSWTENHLCIWWDQKGILWVVRSSMMRIINEFESRTKSGSAIRMLGHMLRNKLRIHWKHSVGICYLTPYSPNLTPSDFYLFRPMQHGLI